MRSYYQTTSQLAKPQGQGLVMSTTGSCMVFVQETNEFWLLVEELTLIHSNQGMKDRPSCSNIYVANKLGPLRAIPWYTNNNTTVAQNMEIKF